MNRAKATFFLPVLDNDGRDLTAEHEVVRDAVYDLCDGWTFLGFVDGAFRMADGTKVVDKNAAYMVVIDENRIGELEEVLRRFRARTLQEAVYLEIQRGVDFRFLN